MRRTGAVALALLLVGCGGSGLDSHGRAACDEVKQIDSGGTAGSIDSVVGELKAITDAGKSSNAALRRASAATSQASSLDPSDPLYENPGDVEYAAVAAWCRRHG